MNSNYLSTLEMPFSLSAAGHSMEEEPALSQEEAILWLLCHLGLSKTSQHLAFVDIYYVISCRRRPRGQRCDRIR